MTFGRAISLWFGFGLVALWAALDAIPKLMPRPRTPTSDFVWRALEPVADITAAELAPMFGQHVYAATQPPCFRFLRDDFEAFSQGVRRHLANPCGPDQIGDEER